jgi:hypothetical protein
VTLDQSLISITELAKQTLTNRLFLNERFIGVFWIGRQGMSERKGGREGEKKEREGG